MKYAPGPMYFLSRSSTLSMIIASMPVPAITANRSGSPPSTVSTTVSMRRSSDPRATSRAPFTSSGSLRLRARRFPVPAGMIAMAASEPAMPAATTRTVPSPPAASTSSAPASSACLVMARPGSSTDVSSQSGSG